MLRPPSIPSNHYLLYSDDPKKIFITKEQYKSMYDEGKLNGYKINMKIIDSFNKSESVHPSFTINNGQKMMHFNPDIKTTGPSQMRSGFDFTEFPISPNAMTYNYDESMEEYSSEVKMVKEVHFLGKKILEYKFMKSYKSMKTF